MKTLYLSLFFLALAVFGLEPNERVQLGTPNLSGNQITINLPACQELFGYQPALRYEVQDTVRFRFQIDGTTLPRLDADGVPRLRTAGRWQEGGVLETEGAQVVELSLAGLLKAKCTLTVQADRSTTLLHPELLLVPEGPSAMQHAPLPEKGALSIEPGPELRLLWKGKPLIYGDEMVGIGAMSVLDGELKCDSDEAGATIAANFLVKHPVADFRRELALDPQGAVELSMRIAYKQDFPNNYEWYSFGISADLLEGAAWETRSGSAGGFQKHSGVLKLADIAENGAVFTQKEIRYLHLEKGDLHLNLDFNPYGSCDWYSRVPYAGNPIGIVTHVNKVGDEVRFYITKRPRAERYAAKIRISVGDNDFAFRHYNTAASYYVGPFIGNPGLRLFFGPEEAVARRNATLPAPNRNALWGCMPFQSVDGIPYLPKLQAGWVSCPDNVRSYERQGLFPVAAGVAAQGEAEARFTIPALPGVYQLQLTMGHPEQPQGPYSILFNDELVAEDITLEAGEYRQLFVSLYLAEPMREAMLTIRGRDWSLNQLIWRNAASPEEDFCIRRRFWRVPGLPAFGYRSDVWAPDPPAPPVKQCVVLGTELTPPLRVTKATLGTGLVPKTMVVPPLSKTDASVGWAWNLCLTSLSLGNAESGFAFTDEAFLRQRLEELRAKGFNAVNEQGLFWHASYGDKSFEGLIEHQKKVNRIVHEYGLKVIRHVDGPSCSLMAEGLANFARFPGGFQQHVSSMQSFMGIGCINNPSLRNWIFHRIGDYVAATDADGVMVDECILTGRDQCACIHCRRKFFADTGCILPFPGDDSLAFDDASPLHARWVEWKLRCNAEFYRDLREYVAKVRPGTLVTAYDIDRELCDGGGRTGYRADMFSQTTDFFGSEPCAINLYVNYRNYLALRKIMLAFSRTYGHPVWALTYSWGMQDKSVEGLLGWMLAAFSAHGGWFGQELANPAFAWKERMDARHAESIADVAVFYCPDARSFVGARWQPYMEAVGISETLSDRHLPHDFVTQADLARPERLARYKVLVLGNVNILSDAELGVLANWVRAGGRLLVSGTFAQVNGDYEPRDSAALTELTGVKTSNVFRDLQSGEAEVFGQTLPLPPRMAPFELAGAEPMARLADGNAWLARHRIGEGEVWTSALPLGEAQCEKQFFRGQRYEFKYDAAFSAWAPAVVSAVHQGAFPVSVGSVVPKEQRVEVYRDSRNGRLYCHWINLRGTRGDIVGKIPPAELPQDAFKDAVDMEMEFDGEFVHAYAISPDFEGHLSLKCVVVQGRTRVTLPGKALLHYTLVVLETE